MINATKSFIKKNDFNTQKLKKNGKYKKKSLAEIQSNIPNYKPRKQPIISDLEKDYINNYEADDIISNGYYK